MPAVVSDSSPLIYLAWLGQFDLLRQLYGQLAVPVAVWDEVALRGGDLPGAGELRNAAAAGWIRVEMPTKPLDPDELAGVKIDLGEIQAIAIAIEQRTLLIIDDSDGRQVARRLGVEVTGTLGVLVRAKHQKLIPALRPLVFRLRNETSFHVAGMLLDSVLTELGEPPIGHELK
jgi:predicted nucleic acid-binding protein